MTPAASSVLALEPDSKQLKAMHSETRLSRSSSWGLPEWFAVAQVAGPAILYLPGSQAFRTPLRIGVFALSLFGLVWCLRIPPSTRPHPSWRFLVLAGLYMAAMILHPATNTILAGVAQVGMHFAVVAPLFWAPRYFRGDPPRLLRVLTILWVLNGASVLVGILQVRNPAAWMPAEFSRVMNTFNNKTTVYEYRAADGSVVIRPPGLGDHPGAASGAGMFVGIMGLAYLALPVSRLRKAVAALMGLAGVIVIFLSHVRSALVVLLGCSAVHAMMMIRQGRLKTVLTVGLLMAVGGVGSIIFAESLGGQTTLSRFATLLQESPETVIQKSGRLYLVTQAFDTFLFEYPLGAGLGRWGMMRRYFGDESNIDSPEIWSEIQFSSWILDGGIVLLCLYLIAIAVAIQRVARSSLLDPSNVLAHWGPVIIMLSAGPIALLFSYTPFNSQTGAQFWFLIGAFEGLSQGGEADAVPDYHLE